MKAVLFALTLLVANHALALESHPYAVLGHCATAERTAGAVVLIELTSANAKCALQAAQEPRVYMITSSPEIAEIARETAPWKTVVHGPALQSSDVASQLNAALARAGYAAEQSRYKGAFIWRLPPDAGVQIGAAGAGWRLM